MPVSITAVSSLSRAFLLMWSTGDSGANNAAYHQATGYFSATNQITFQRYGTTDDCEIAYFVVEALQEDFEVVESGSITIGATSTTQPKTLGQSINQTRSFIIADSRIGGNGAVGDCSKGFATVHFTADNAILATRNASGTYTCEVRYQVVQWHSQSGVVVQTGEYQASIGTTETTANVNPPVDPSRTWLYTTYRHSSNGLSQTAVCTRLIDGSTVGFRRYQNSYTSGMRLWAIQFPSDVVVQRDNGTTADKNDLTFTATFGQNVTVAGSWADVSNNCNGTGTLFPRPRWYPQITDVDEVTCTRFYGGQLSDLAVQVIDTSAWFIFDPVTVTANAVTTDAVGAGAQDVLIQDVTLSNQMAVAQTVTSVTVENAGTATDAEIASVKLYYDSNNSNDYTSGVDQLVGSGTFTSGSKVFSGLSIALAASGSEELYIVYGLSDTVTDGHTLDARFPIDGIAFQAEFSVADTATNSSGTRPISLVLDHFVLDHDNAALAGDPETVSVTVKDDKGNTLTAYTGTVTLDTDGAGDITWALSSGAGAFTDGGAGADTAAYTFHSSDAGAAAFTITDLLAETIDISVSGGGTTDDNTEGDLVVSPNVLDHFVLSHDGEGEAGVAETVGVVAKDEHENTLSDYTGTILLDTDGTVTAIAWTKLSGAGDFLDGGSGSDTASYAFDEGDNGQASFTLTDTAVETLDISASGGGKQDDGTQGNLVIGPTSLDHFVLSHDGEAQAGTPESVGLTVKDTYNNTKTNYAGTVTLDTDGTVTAVTWVLSSGAGVFTDNGPSYDTADYTFDPGDAGTVTFTVNDTKTETLSLSASGGGKTDDNTEGSLVVKPGVLGYFVVSHDGTGVTDVEEAVTVTAKDANGNTKTDYGGGLTVDTDGSGAIAWALSSGAGPFTDGGGGDDTADYTFDPGDSGVVTLGLTDDTAEELDIEASGGGATDDNTHGSLTIVSSGIDHFVIGHDGNAITGVPETVTITAENANDETLLDYTGLINIDTTGTETTITWALSSGAGTFTDGGPTADTATYRFDATDDGVVTLTVTDTVEEPINISVAAGSKTDDDTEGNLVINAAGLHHFALSHDGNGDAGVAESVTITAKDANAGTVTGYTGTITVDTDGTATAIGWARETGNGGFIDGGSGSDTAQYTYVTGDYGVCVLAVTDTKAETINIGVSGSGRADDDTEGTLAIGPGAIGSFKIAHDGAAQAGVADNVGITAYDLYDNVRTNHTGTITVDTDGTENAITWALSSGAGAFTDNGASVDTADYTYVSGDSGVVTLTVADTQTESLDLSVSGGGKTDDNTEGDLSVGPGTLDYFVVVHDGAAQAGVADNVGITAYDLYGNVKTDHTGTITVDTNGTTTTVTWALSSGSGAFTDNGASYDTADYTYVGGDSGVVTLTVADTKTEPLDIVVTGGGKTDDNSAADLSVGPGTLDYFVVAHDGNAQAGMPESVGITAYDLYDNVRTNHTGTITVDTDGAEDAITWALSSGSGAFTDNGASYDTAAYTYVGGDYGVVTLTVADTVTQTLDISVQGSGKTDDNSASGLVVGAGTLDHFVVGHDGQGIVDSYEPVTVTAKDQYENSLTAYTGSITVSTTGETGEITWILSIGDGSFLDGGAGSDTASYTYTGVDSGTVTLSIKDDTADTVDVEASGDGKTDDDSEGSLTFTSDSIIIDNVDTNPTPPKYEDYGTWSTRTGGVEYGGDASGWRRNTNPQPGVGGDWARWTPDISIAGNYEVFVFWRTGMAQLATDAPYTVYYDGGSTTTDENQEQGGEQFVSIGTYKFAAGTSGYVELTNDADDDVCADAVKWVLVGSASGQANAVTTASVTSGQSDILIQNVLISNNTTTADTITSVTVSNIGTATDAEIAAVKLYYDSDSSGTYSSGVDQQVGSGVFTSGTKIFSGLNISLSASGIQYLFVTVDLATAVTDGHTLDAAFPVNGVVLTNAPALPGTALNSEGTRPVVLTLDHFVISHGGTATAGVPEGVSVTAKDAHGNTKISCATTINLDTDGTGDITWAKVMGNGSFADGGPGYDTATYTFDSDNGTASFTLTDTKAESLDISVSGGGTTDDNTEGDLVVSFNTLDHFLITHDAAAVAGTAENVSVSAQDAYDNLITDHMGTVTLDTDGTQDAIVWALDTGFGPFTDGGAGLDTADYTFVSGDSGTAAFTIIDTKTETLNISASGGGVTDDNSEGGLVVKPALLDHFLIQHDTAAQAGVAENVVILAKDAYGNTKTDHTGLIVIDTDGTPTTIAWAKVMGNGTFADGGVDFDTAEYTYLLTDHGSVTLSVTDTAMESLDISASGGGSTDDNTEGDLVVGPGLIDEFRITHDGFALQNAAEAITIKAYDAYNNVKSDYTGTITVDTNGTPAAIAWALSSGAGTLVDGGAGSDTASYAFAGGDSGQVVLSLTDDTAEIINISVAGDGKADDDNEGVLEVVAAGFHHFHIAHDGSAVAGVAEDITITAQDVSNQTVTNYVGTMTVDTTGTASAITWALSSGAGSFADGGPTYDTAEYVFVGGDDGVVVLTLTDTQTDTLNISAAGSGKADDDTEGNLVVHPAGVHHFVLSHDNAATAGTAEDVVVTVKDANGTTVAGHTGTITLDTTGTPGTIAWALSSGAGAFTDGGGSVDTADYTFVSGDSGTATLTITDTKTETLNISASGGGKTDDNSEGDLVVGPALLDHFLIQHDTAAQAGVAENIVVLAKDAYGNTKTNHAGTISVDTTGTPTTIAWALSSGTGAFTDGGGSVDTADYTYLPGDNGSVTLGLTDTTMESLNISASGGGTTDDNTEGDLVVGPGSLNHFVVAHDGAAVAGVADTVTVTAYDVYSNIKTNHAGTITVDTTGTPTTIGWALSSGYGSFTDGGGSFDTAAYTFVGGDYGVVELSVTDTKAEPLDIDVAGSGKVDLDTEPNLVVGPNVLYDFRITHDGQAEAGVPETVKVEARDFYDNTQKAYTGTISLDTTGEDGTIAWALSSGSGAFTDGGGSVDTADYTFDAGDLGTVQFTINDTTAESLNISVTGSGKTDDNAEGDLTVAPTVLASFVISHDGTAIQSVEEPIGVTAKDTYGNTKTNYAGTISLDTNGTADAIAWALSSGYGAFTDGGAPNDTADYTYAVGDSGTATFGMTDTSAETINISVSGGGTTDDNTEGDLVVQASSVTVDVTANALSSSYAGQGATGRFVLDATLTNNNVLAGDTLTQVVVSNAGSISDAQVQNVKLYYDSNNSESYSPGVDQQVGTGAFSSGSVTFGNLTVALAAAGTERLFVTVDLTGSASDQATVDVSIPANGLTFASAPPTPATAINSSGLVTVDAGLPGLVSNLVSSSHNNAIGAWNDPQSRDDTIAVSWTAATDAGGGSGIDGYSILWDTSPTTLPDTTKDVEQTVSSTISAARSDGTSHYVHIRSVDNVGNWSASAAHLGPFYIDTTPPASGSIYDIAETVGGDYLYYNAATTTLYYSGLGYSAFKVYVEAADTTSGLKQAVFPSTTAVGGTDATEADDVYEYEFTYTITSAGSSYQNVNVVVSDLAGNTANVPFSVVLDNTPPSLVSSLSSSTHTPGVSSDDNDVFFQWSETTDSQSGLAGYSFWVDTNATTLPPKYVNLDPPTSLTYEAYDLANGNHYGHVRPVDRVGNWTASATHAGPYIIGRGALTASLASSKSVVSTDQAFTVTMTVSNPGAVAVDTVDPSSLTVVSPPGQNATATTTSDPSPQNINPTSQKQFVWNYTAGTINGSLSLEGSASGYDTEGLVTSNTAKSADVVVENKAVLGITVSALPATPRIGETITVKATITNTGQADALNVAPSLTPSGAGNPLVDTGPSPANTTIKGGAFKIFTFTAHGQSTGNAVFTADLDSGVDENSGANLSCNSGQDSVTVQSKPTYGLTSSVSATPVAVNVAGTITVTMAVQNTGENTVTNVAPTSLTVGGTSSDAILSTGPEPTGVSSLGATATQDFTWTYTAGETLGIVTFAGYATSDQTQSTQTTSNAVTIQAEAAALSSSITAAPSSPLTNAPITVTMTVSNTAGAGGASANNVKPSLLTVNSNATSANLEAGPTPPSATIAAGADQQFVWTYEAGRNPGTLSFSGNASGTDANSSADVNSTTNSSNTVTVTNLSPAWKYPTDANVKGPIRTIPIAYDDKIYFGSDDNNLYILNDSTKDLSATFVTSGQIRGIPWPSTEEYSPGVYKDVVYFGTLGNSLYAVWEDNVVKWSKTIGAGESLTTSVLYEPTYGIYFGTSGQKVYCVEPSLGADVWAQPAEVGGAIESSPAMIYVPFLYYDEIYFGANDGKLYGFKAEDGTGVRVFDTGFGSAGAIKSAPFIALQDPIDPGSRRLIFFGTTNGRFYAVNLSAEEMGTSYAETGWAENPKEVGGAINSAPWVDTETIAVYFGCADGKLYAYNLADGTAKENFPVDIGAGIDSWPYVANGIVYFGADDGKFYAVDTATGDIVDGWPYDTGAPIKSGVSLQYVDADHIYVLVGSDSGRVYSFKTAN